MNKRDWVILAVIATHGHGNFRDIVQRTGYSLGLISSSLRKLTERGYLDSNHRITDKTKEYMAASKPKRAVILAAGLGLRMTPINMIPKGLLQVNSKPLVENIIEQLHEVGITEIYIVVGHMMERFEYLTDKYNVELIYNLEYANRDTLYSLYLAEDKLSNCYIISSNVWFSRNPFHENEFFSWYAVSEYVDDDSFVRVNRKMELVYTEDEIGGNSMVGLCYLLEKDAKGVRTRLKKLNSKRKYNRRIWERALLDGQKMIAYARIMTGQSAYAVKTYDELRELDSESQNLQSKRIKYICEMFGITDEEVTDISGLFKGMTNRHMRFSVDGKPYLLRIPGEGSNEIINRQQEFNIYETLKGKGITDLVTYISPEEGYKITEYWEESRNCDPENFEEVEICIKHLKKLHDMELEVDHSFNLLEKIEWFEKLRNSPSQFTDYDKTRNKMMELLDILGKLPEDRCLCHNDAVYANFMFVDEKTYLIDWEYAGMCDIHFDIAMFGIFAYYDKAKIDKVIDIYFDGDVSDLSRFKVYSYTALGGFLWTVWSEYKRVMGDDQGEYAMIQYKFAKEFYSHAMKLAPKLDV